MKRLLILAALLGALGTGTAAAGVECSLNADDVAAVSFTTIEEIEGIPAAQVEHIERQINRNADENLEVFADACNLAFLMERSQGVMKFQQMLSAFMAGLDSGGVEAQAVQVEEIAAFARGLGLQDEAD